MYASGEKKAFPSLFLGQQIYFDYHHGIPNVVVPRNIILRNISVGSEYVLKPLVVFFIPVHQPTISVFEADQVEELERTLGQTSPPDRYPSCPREIRQHLAAYLSPPSNSYAC